MSWRKRLGISAAIAVVGFAALVLLLGRGLFGHFDSATLTPVLVERPADEVMRAVSRQREAAARVGAEPGVATDEQILFGDLHVHTTISFDAFMLNLPITGGTGAATPADACDFARHCAALDFWSINDHASNIHPDDWQNSIEAVRQCNALAGDPERPDTVAFLGWEWTQAGLTPDTHYGHKNVVLAHTDDAHIPTRPIAASAGGLASNPPNVFARGLLAMGSPRFRDLARRWTALAEVELCPDGRVRDLPDTCREVAETPADLFAKLDDWGHDALVIPHGTSWGIYTPPGSTWQKQLRGAMHDPERQTLFEVSSGHGDSEVYRDWRAIAFAGDGTPVCPEASPDYLPMCRRAGEIVLARCLADGEGDAECEARAEEARRHAVVAGASPHVTVPGTTGADWLDAGQCRDCGQPAFKYRPGGSAQYVTALGDFAEDADAPRRFRFGFLASSDIHVAKPGTGYKEIRALSETRGQRTPDDGGIAASFFTAPPEPPASRSRSYGEAAATLSGIQLFETERTQSFLYTGGLVAVHASGRDRGAIWDALERKQVYGTSGPRILLWFDLLHGDAVVPMGGEMATSAAPSFRVRAVGSFEQQAGCPDSAAQALGPERQARLCHGECYAPSDRRRAITHIEVVRIRPQTRPDEPLADLIEDPWRRFDCPADGHGCAVELSDPDFSALGRDTVYYARAYEEPTPTVNGRPLRCETDATGRCIESNPCTAGEECLDPYAARAWSSPIYVDYAGHEATD